MSTQRPRWLSRRRFLRGLTLAGTAGLFEVDPIVKTSLRTK